jgi:hypothetical protein
MVENDTGEGEIIHGSVIHLVAESSRQGNSLEPLELKPTSL